MWVRQAREIQVWPRFRRSTSRHLSLLCRLLWKVLPFEMSRHSGPKVRGWSAASLFAWHYCSDPQDHACSADGSVDLNRMDACYDTTTTITIQILDTCPCKGNEKWCCGDANLQHFDLSAGAFSRLAPQVGLWVASSCSWRCTGPLRNTGRCCCCCRARASSAWPGNPCPARPSTAPPPSRIGRRCSRPQVGCGWEVQVFAPQLQGSRLLACSGWSEPRHLPWRRDRRWLEEDGARWAAFPPGTLRGLCILRRPSVAWSLADLRR